MNYLPPFLLKWLTDCTTVSLGLMPGIDYSFTYDPAGRPVSITEGSATYYYVLNQQGDVVGLMNGEEQLVVVYLYDAWGRLLSTTGTQSSTLGVNNPLRYRGYVYDTETGLYYLQSRYYNPTWGRFINADDPGYMGVDGTPSSYNLFSYCGNNPVTREDSEGEFWLAIGIGFIAGLVTQYINDVAENIDDGKTGFAIFKPKSEISDYVASGIGGAIGSIPGLGFWGSMAAGSVGNVFTEYMKGNINSWGDLGSVALDGVLASGFGEGVTKGMSFIKVKQIGKMPRMSRKSFLRDKLFCNAQSSVNANLRTFVGNSLRTNMNLVEDQLPIFRSGIYSTAASSLWSLF